MCYLKLGVPSRSKLYFWPNRAVTYYCTHTSILNTETFQDGWRNTPQETIPASHTKVWKTSPRKTRPTICCRPSHPWRIHTFYFWHRPFCPGGNVVNGQLDREEVHTTEAENPLLWRQGKQYTKHTYIQCRLIFSTVLGQTWAAEGCPHVELWGKIWGFLPIFWVFSQIFIK